MRTQGDRVDPPWSTSLLPSSPSPWAFRFSRAHSRLHSVRHLNHQPSSSTPGVSPDSRLGRRRGSPWTRCDVSAGPGWRRDGGRRAQGKRQVRGREERKMSPGVERGEARGRSSFCPFLSLCSPEAIPGHSARDQASAPVIRDPNSYRLLVSGTRRRARSCPQRAGKGHGGSVEHWERALRVPSSSSFSLVLSIRAPGPPSLGFSSRAWCRLRAVCAPWERVDPRLVASELSNLTPSISLLPPPPLILLLLLSLS